MEEGIYSIQPKKAYLRNILPTFVAVWRGEEPDMTRYQFLIKPNGHYLHPRPPTGGEIAAPIEMLSPETLFSGPISSKLFAEIKKVATLDDIKEEVLFQEQLHAA